MKMQSLKTPCLLLDADRVKKNAARIGGRVREMGARLRPHIKTHKCVEVARIQTAGHAGAITVSTLAEARAFAAAGFGDVTYAVPIEPGKFAEAIEISRQCEKFALLTDDPGIPGPLNEAARRAGVGLDVFLKVDCGYHRCGVQPESAHAVEIPRAIQDASHLRFAGILTHAGHSYHCRSGAETLAVARQERDVMVEVASRLRNAGVEVPTVSVGSTPSISCVDHLDGVDEARPGNYIFFDATQVRLGSCGLEDCALTVLAAVVHRDASRRKVIVDAGAIALSKDPGPADLDPECGYGPVLSTDGENLGLRLRSLSQEHGVLEGAGEGAFGKLQIGARVRIVANHSCLAAAQHNHYHVVEGDRVADRWEIFRGW